jgi:hypothetical protein
MCLGSQTAKRKLWYPHRLISSVCDANPCFPVFRAFKVSCLKKVMNTIAGKKLDNMRTRGVRFVQQFFGASGRKRTTICLFISKLPITIPLFVPIWRIYHRIQRAYSKSIPWFQQQTLQFTWRLILKYAPLLVSIVPPFGISVFFIQLVTIEAQITQPRDSWIFIL